MAPWYLSNIPQLKYRWWLNEVLNVAEGNPAVGSPDAWLYYLRALMTDQALVPLGVLWGICIVLLTTLRSKDEGTAVLLGWTMVTYVVMILFALKDIRFTMPYLPAAAVTTALGIKVLRPSWMRTGLVTVLVAYCLVEFAGLSWGLSQILPPGALAPSVNLLGVSNPTWPIRAVFFRKSLKLLDRDLKVCTTWPVLSQSGGS